MRVVAATCGIAVLTFGVFACDQNAPSTPVEPSVNPMSPGNPLESTVSGDSVYWVDNYAAFEGEDHFWEYSRQGSGGIYPVVHVWRDGEYLGRVQQEYDQGGSPVRDTLVTPEGYWGYRDSDGTYLETTSAGGKPGGPNPESTPALEAGFSVVLSQCVATVNSILRFFGCYAQQEAAVDAAKTTAISGLLGSVLNVASGGATTPYTFAALSVKLADGLSKLGSWISCELQQ